MTLALKNRVGRSIFLVAGNRDARYGSPKSTVNPVVGRENPDSKRRNSAPISIAGAFFTPAVQLYGGRARADFGLAGFLLPRFLTPRTAATQSREKDGGSSSSAKGVPPMHALNPSRIRAYAHRRLALAALRANSSLSVRIARYNHHAEIARALEGQGGAQ